MKERQVNHIHCGLSRVLSIIYSYLLVMYIEKAIFHQAIFHTTTSKEAQHLLFKAK